MANDYEVTNNRILQEIMSLHRQIATVNVQIGEIQLHEASRMEREKTYNDLANKNYTAINGNGKPGLKADVQSLKEAMGRINWAGGVFVAVIIADIATRIIAAR